MNFASRDFLIFLPLVLAIYHTLPTRAPKYRFLLAASWVFYMWWNPWFILVVLFTTIVDFWAGRLIEAADSERRRRAFLVLSLSANLGMLAIFKYTGFIVDNSLALARALGWPAPEWTVHIVLPVGISFHTFQGMGYTMEVYRRRLAAARSFRDFALFIAFFPQLVAGPILRPQEFLPQLETPSSVGPQQVSDGLHLVLSGLFKKVFLADQLARFVDPVFASPGLYSDAAHRWATLAYAGQIYCDFSGYTDIALGCGKWLGFELPVNFRLPYAASSLTDFWRRWHITLSTWLRDYLYIPLGGSRRGTVRTYVNLLVVMTLCGLWHGASWNFVAWGVYNGVFLAIHRAFDRAVPDGGLLGRLRQTRPYNLVAVGSTLLIVLVGLVLVRSQSWEGLLLMETSLLGIGPGRPGQFIGTPPWVRVLVGMVAIAHVWGACAPRLRLPGWPVVARAAVYTVGVILLVVFGPWNGKPFIYFQF